VCKSLGIESGKKKAKRKKRDTQAGTGTLGSRLVDLKKGKLVVMKFKFYS